MKFEYVTCPKCERRFGVLAGTGKLAIEALPDPFEARCLHCAAISTFTKADLHTTELNVSSPR
jgi:hypothetical protein